MGVAEWHIQTTEKPSHTVIDCKKLAFDGKILPSGSAAKNQSYHDRFDRITTTVIIVYKKLTS
jgi:hypothetical protein